MSLQYYFCMLEACILNDQMNCCDTVQYTRTLVALLAPLILGKKKQRSCQYNAVMLPQNHFCGYLPQRGIATNAIVCVSKSVCNPFLFPFV